ncbi:Nitroreductase family protein [Quillaja saponaria]|uniref:Nitroreductase family protein n=1 Tax=Quillaja saponaria TaxID=32244 RepID=A0AAD7L3R9_QUISA|nr:Nitroreductase family protein [Quillaja saponaria]
MRFSSLNPRYYQFLPSTSVIPTLTSISKFNKRLSGTPSMSFSSPSSFSPPSSSANSKEAVDDQGLLQVLKYHNQTKHSFTKYARGPHGLDWANQPNPFRRYDSAPLLPLLHFPIDNETVSLSTIDAPLYSSLFLSLPPPKPISKSTISQFFYDSLALSAWKTTGFSTWSLRVNPSSGNLHPTEAYIISPPIESVSDSPFVAHYAPKEHSLELRTKIPSEFFPRFFPHGSFLVGLSSIFWREAWKYGERAFRYCNHDVGHAIAAVTMAAAGLGWDVKLLDGLGYEDLKKIMGLQIFPEFEIPSRAVKGKIPEIEFEHPDCVLLVFPNGIGEFDVNYKELSSSISEFSKLEWKGKPNFLSKEHICWDIIYRTAEVVKKPLTLVHRLLVDPFQRSGLYGEDSYKGFTTRQVVRKRRSAVDMDGVTEIERDVFYQILSHCLPSGCEPREKQKRQLALPFRTLAWDAEVHAALFVHRVAGLPQGLYFLLRNENHLDELKKAMNTDFVWAKPEGCPDDLPLYELFRTDCRRLSKQLSCHQDIASDGCFSLGMLARFQPCLREKGVWMYPRLFWETGVLGQVLYLEAHAVGVSATGIGCFFDDPGDDSLRF